jgi:hypothetical protein
MRPHMMHITHITQSEVISPLFHIRVFIADSFLSAY